MARLVTQPSAFFDVFRDRLSMLQWRNYPWMLRQSMRTWHMSRVEAQVQRHLQTLLWIEQTYTQIQNQFPSDLDQAPFPAKMFWQENLKNPKSHGFRWLYYDLCFFFLVSLADLWFFFSRKLSFWQGRCCKAAPCLVLANRSMPGFKGHDVITLVTLPVWGRMTVNLEFSGLHPGS